MTAAPPLPDDLRAATVDADALRRFLGELPAADDEDVARRAATIAAGAGADADTAATAIGLVDLTTLDAADTPARVRELCATAVAPDPDDPSCPPVAAVCVYPDLIGVVAQELADAPVRAASVAGAFPHSRSPLEVKLAEVRAAVAAGADEIDCVLDRGALLDDRAFDAFEQLQAIVGAAGDAHVKVILESGSLPDLGTVRRAAWVAFLAGADVVKTSTGKDGAGASLPAALVMLEVARAFGERTGRVTGVKASGGIRTTEEAAAYLAVVREVCDESWLTPARFRFGASSLLADLVRVRRG